MSRTTRELKQQWIGSRVRLLETVTRYGAQPLQAGTVFPVVDVWRNRVFLDLGGVFRPISRQKVEIITPPTHTTRMAAAAARGEHSQARAQLEGQAPLTREAPAPTAAP